MFKQFPRDPADVSTCKTGVIPITLNISGRVYHTLGEIICVAPECNDTRWEKVIQRLAAGNHWESVSMLITGLHRYLYTSRRDNLCSS